MQNEHPTQDQIEMWNHLQTLTDAEIESICQAGPRFFGGGNPASRAAGRAALNDIDNARLVKSERRRAGTWTL